MSCSGKTKKLNENYSLIFGSKEIKEIVIEYQKQDIFDIYKNDTVGVVSIKFSDKQNKTNFKFKLENEENFVDIDINLIDTLIYFNSHPVIILSNSKKNICDEDKARYIKILKSRTYHYEKQVDNGIVSYSLYEPIYWFVEINDGEVILKKENNSE